MEKIKKYKSYIIVSVIALLILVVYLLKLTTPVTLDDCTDPNCTNHHHEEKSYTVYNFSSKLCPACDKMKPIYNKMKNEYEHNLDFEYIDVNLDSRLANKYNVQYTPTFVIVDKEGKVVDELIGYEEEDKFRNFVDKWVSE